MERGSSPPARADNRVVERQTEALTSWMCRSRRRPVGATAHVLKRRLAALALAPAFPLRRLVARSCWLPRCGRSARRRVRCGRRRAKAPARLGAPRQTARQARSRRSGSVCLRMRLARKVIEALALGTGLDPEVWRSIGLPLKKLPNAVAATCAHKAESGPSFRFP